MSSNNIDLNKKEIAKKKLARIPIKINPTPNSERKRLPEHYKIAIPKASEKDKIRNLRDIKNKTKIRKLATVCAEASCPNLSECYSKGTASFMIMGENCTRRCSFCNVAHGKPLGLDPNEPENLAQTIYEMGLKYVVITSVDRDDLRDGGANHFAQCIKKIRDKCENITIEILTPDFRGRMDKALEIFKLNPPDVFNHNLETAPSLYKQARPGSDYQWSLDLLRKFKLQHPDVPTKSGLMLGLGETDEEIIQVMKDLRSHNVDMLTLGQYLQPTEFHMPIDRYVSIQQFQKLGEIGKDLGFKHVASGPKVRSSYHADIQFDGDLI
jgi:lipoic acid synthetase